MKVSILLLFCFTEGVLGLNIPSRTSRRTRNSEDPCAVSPCAANAECQSSAAGIIFCQCRLGFTGDALEKCEPIVAAASFSIHTASPAVFHNPKKPSDIVDYTEIAKSPVHVTVEYATSTHSSQDLSRVPILGVNEPNRELIVSSNTPLNSHSQTPVHSNNWDSQTPTSFILSKNENNALGQITQPQQDNPAINFIVPDPMGKYKQCRNINGIVACADITDPISQLQMQPNQQKGQQFGSSLHSSQQTSLPTEISSQRINFHDTIPSRTEVVSNNPDIDCKSSCGINSICRMVRNRPVCGCSVGHTGDPTVSCDPIANESSDCQKHTECPATKVCIHSKCIDPCSFQKGSNGSSQNVGDQEIVVEKGAVCGRNAKCIVIEHTPLCGCLEGFYGNPYIGCLAKSNLGFGL